ncbi:MAG: ABC transporter ATP-binding protein, partial [Chloroflexi bacterium]|nr:ABC transporter ATP-binding protein [Chloroflexota bacterium]
SRLSSDVQGLRWFFSGTVVFIITNIVRLFAGAVALLYLEWKMGLGVLLLIPIVVLCTRWFSAKVHVLSHHVMEQEANVLSSIEESLSAASLIKAFSSEYTMVGRLTSRLKALFQTSLEQATVNSVAGAFISLLPSIARAVTLALGAYWIITGQWSLGSLLAFQLYLGYIFTPAEFLATTNLELQRARAALDRVSALFNIVPEEGIGTGIITERLKGDIEFKSVSFSYGSNEPVLSEVSFKVDSGEHIAIVGPSGVGKTTLVSLILRFYRPNTGEIYFDGRPATEYDLNSLRRRIGYVSQSTLLLSGTILENLKYGNPDASEDQVIQAARSAGIHEFIRNLPNGYHTTIGERGINLSEGQKQRISIARALVKDPDILVLDEPTSALDSKTEMTILDSIPTVMGGKTLFIIAHNPCTIQNSHRILLLNESRLIAIGTHQSLMETNSYYYSLFSSKLA